MAKSGPIVFPRIGGILDRYLTRSFLRIFALSLLVTTVLYLIVDFFDRVDNFLKAGASMGVAFQYFSYKLPLFISRVFGFATLFSTFFCLGMLSRNHEITAMRSSGLSLYRIALPLLLVSLLVTSLNFFWNESLVPIFLRKSQMIYKTEVKKKQPQNLVGTKEIWIRGDGVFITADDFDTKRNILKGIVIYLMNRDFSLKGLINAPQAHWDGTRWVANKSKEWLFLANGKIRQRETSSALPLKETPEDLKVFAREPEEFSFSELRKLIADLREKGIDTTPYEADLQVKLALPFISPLLVLLAVPFALKHGRAGGMALSFAFTMIIGIVYWFLLAFSISLGHNGVLPPALAAWIPNFVLLFVGLFFFTGEE